MGMQPKVDSLTNFSLVFDCDEKNHRKSQFLESSISNEKVLPSRSGALELGLPSGAVVYRPALKRAIDIVGASVLLIVLAPLLALLFALVSKDGGSAIYRHRRLGRGGRPFYCLKFRTMRTDSAAVLTDLLANDPERADEWRAGFKLRDDPRVTRIGRVLRKTSLDELPQLINILRGEMSLVGWRPMPRDEFRIYARALRAHGRRPKDILRHHPGLSGLWQVAGRNDLTYPERVALDLEYVDSVALWLDMSILLRTVRAVIRKTGV